MQADFLVGCIYILMLIIGIMVVSETIDYGVHVNERIGPIQALNEINTSTPITKDFLTFTVHGETVQPKFNLFSSGNGTIKGILSENAKGWRKEQYLDMEGRWINPVFFLFTKQRFRIEQKRTLEPCHLL